MLERLAGLPCAQVGGDDQLVDFSSSAVQGFCASNQLHSIVKNTFVSVSDTQEPSRNSPTHGLAPLGLAGPQQQLYVDKEVIWALCAPRVPKQTTLFANRLLFVAF